MKKSIETQQAPAAIGSYSQAVQKGQTIYLSGQIPLDPETMSMVEGGIEAQILRVFENLKAVSLAAGGHLNAIVKLNVYLTDILHLTLVNEVMMNYFTKPYPARTSIAVASLPKGALVEIDAVMVL